MPQRRRPAQRVAELILASGVALTMLASTGATAFAGSTPTPPSPPSAAQVSAAKAAVVSAAAQVAALDGQLALARQRVARLEDTSALAGMASNGARILLQQRTTESATARTQAEAAQRRSAAADLALSQYAAGVFEGGGSGSTLLDIFAGSGPQDVLDRAAGLEAAGAEQARIMRDAGSSRLLSTSLQQAADEADARQSAAAAHALAAASAARADAGDAAAAAARLATQQRLTVTQLAALQKTSVTLEAQRQSALAAQELARQQEAARQAAAVAAAAAAQQAADRAAAQQAAAAAAADAARTAAQAANASAQRAAADQAARQAAYEAGQVTVRQPAPSAPSAPSPVQPTPPPSGAGIDLSNAAMWDRIAQCESSGNWQINTGNGYYGGLQFDIRTWLGAGGADFAYRADLASREQQITIANRVYAQRGLQPWSCGYAA